MLGQQIQVQSSISSNSHIYTFAPLQCSQSQISAFQSASFTDNCHFQLKQDESNQNVERSIAIKAKLQKLKEIYQQGLDKLNFLEQQFKTEQKQKIETKFILETQLRQFSQNQTDKHRKGSQTSTAGEDEEIKGRFDQNQQQIQVKSEGRMSLPQQKIEQIQKKLQQLRKANLRKAEYQVKKIEQLKSQLNQVQTKNEQIKQNSIKQTEEQKVLSLKISELSLQKQKLIQANTLLSSQIRQSQRQVTQLSNSTEYLKATQNCCQQILNEEICSVRYKIEGRRLQYESNKRYLDKVIRSRKYEQNISFQNIQNEIDCLNSYCDDMIKKKNSFYGSDIKKYKQKRLLILEEINRIKEKIQSIGNQKAQLQKLIIQQNLTYDQLQDQYCPLLQKADSRLLNKESVSQDKLSPSQKLQFLNQKKEILSSQLNKITTLYQQIKSQLENDQTLVPQNITKDFQKKIKKRKQQISDIEILTQENAQLQIENQTLNEQKDKIQWKTNPQIETLIDEEKSLLLIQNNLKDTFKSLKEQSQSLQDKIKEFQKIKNQQFNQQKTEGQSKQKQEQQRLIKMEDEKKRQNLQNLMDKFRQKNQRQQRQKQQLEEKRRQNEHLKCKNTPTKSKKGKNKENRADKFDSEIKESRGVNFFGGRENPLDRLYKDFPLNRSLDTFSNTSLLQSNPTLYMMLIFFIVVIPGLCIGYNI